MIYPNSPLRSDQKGGSGLQRLMGEAVCITVTVCLLRKRDEKSVSSVIEVIDVHVPLATILSKDAGVDMYQVHSIIMVYLCSYSTHRTTLDIGIVNEQSA